MTDTKETVEQTEAVNPLLRTIEFSIQRKDVDAAVAKELRKAAKTAKFHGFRPGKAPFAMVEAAYGAEAQYRAINDLAIDAFVKLVEADKLQVVGTPDIAPSEKGADEEVMNFKATFEVFPEIEVPELKDVEVKQFECTLTEEDFNKTIDIMRKQRVSYEVADRAAADTDRITLNFKGTLDGVAFDGGTAEGYKFVLGAGQMLGEFEEAVRGMKAGEEKTFPLTFPENYGAKELAGKQVQFEVKVTEVAAQVLPELNDAFAESLGITEGGIEKMKADIRENLEREVESRKEGRTKESAMDAILSAATFAVPTAMIEDERQKLVRQLMADMKARGMDVEKFPINEPTIMKDQAEKRVRLGLQINAIVEKEGLTASDEAIKALAENISKSFEDPKEVVDWYLNNPQRKAELAAVALENAVVAWVLSKAKVAKEEVSFDTLMNRQA